MALVRRTRHALPKPLVFKACWRVATIKAPKPQDGDRHGPKLTKELLPGADPGSFLGTPSTRDRSLVWQCGGRVRAPPECQSPTQDTFLCNQAASSLRKLFSEASSCWKVSWEVSGWKTWSKVWRVASMAAVCCPLFPWSSKIMSST